MFRWVGLALAVIGAIMAVIAGAHSHLEVAILGILLFIIGIFVISRANY
jgi:drug/metabolite transporter (DMT)-like permease